jgi:hypothetical protein
MKLLPKKHFRQGERGMATIMFITLLTIMVLLATANGMALIRLHREVKFVEQQQIKRLNGPQTHFTPATPAVTNSNSK